MTEKEQSASTSNKRKAEWFEIDEDHNTYVYVSGLPGGLTEDDFIELMRKYGIIAKKTLPGQPFNIKLYKNQEGLFKGDALCCYVRKESVDLALTHLDGYQYDDKHILHCERAKFQMKGDYDPTKKPRVLDKKAKQKQKKKIEQLLSWEEKMASNANQKKVILKNMFMPEEILEDATLLLDLKEDVEAACSEIQCEPKRVDIYDKHPEGVIAVTFDNHDQAAKCIKALDNQWFAQRRVKAEFWDGKTKYKIKETDEETQKRTEKWHEDIQKSDDDQDEVKLLTDSTKEDNSQLENDQTSANDKSDSEQDD